MVKALILLFFCVIAFAEQVEIKADNFYANENELKSEFDGNVVVKRNNDELIANKAIVYFDKQRKPLKYVAIGNVKFKAIVDTRHYEGSGEKLVYDVKANTYTVDGKAHLKEHQSNKNVYGQKITINQKDGTYNVSGGSNTPVRFTFNIEEKKN